MSGWEIGFMVAGMAMSAVGAGMQYNAQKQSAANQEALAKYNYAVEQQNIRQQQALAEYSAQNQARAAQANAAMVQQAADANALAYDQQADSALRQGVEGVRRSREDQLRFAAIQVGRIGKSGVATAGSPVETLAESAKLMGLALNDAWYTSNVEASRFQRQAEMERYGGRAGAANYGIQAGLALAEGAMAPIQARMDMRRASVGKMIALDQAAGMKSAATAQLVGNIGTLLSSSYGSFKGFGGGAGSAGGVAGGVSSASSSFGKSYASGASYTTLSSVGSGLRG
ncbi:MAG TPA: hypothetical protein VK956_07485 [Verrucomicrobium sp.]|nr:hypothetical protein [Verrucomicrobium sp.]